MKDKPILFGAVVASIVASMCCILPVAVALLGVGSVAAGAAFERFRLPLSLLTFGFLGLAFYFNYRPREVRNMRSFARSVTRKVRKFHPSR